MFVAVLDYWSIYENIISVACSCTIWAKEFWLMADVDSKICSLATSWFLHTEHSRSWKDLHIFVVYAVQCFIFNSICSTVVTERNFIFNYIVRSIQLISSLKNSWLGLTTDGLKHCGQNFQWINRKNTSLLWTKLNILACCVEG